LLPPAATSTAAPAQAESSQPHKIGIIGSVFTGNSGSSPAEAGFTSWYFGRFGAELTVGYRGPNDTSRTDRKTSGTIESQTTTGTDTTTTYRSGGSTVYDSNSSAWQLNLTLMPKMKLVELGHTFFYVGIPVTMITQGTLRNNTTDTSLTWNNNGTATNYADDYTSNRNVITIQDETTSKMGLRFGLLAGAAFTFDSLPGLELGFSVGWRFATAVETSRAISYNAVSTNYNAAGAVTSSATATGPGAAATVADGVQSKNSTGMGTFNNGEVLAGIRIAYYFW
jgi:hypothetical protein